MIKAILPIGNLSAIATESYNKNLRYAVIPKFVFKIGSLFNKKLKELLELLPRYEHNNIFDDSKFRKRFPEFQVTTYQEGISQIKGEQSSGKK